MGSRTKKKTTIKRLNSEIKWRKGRELMLLNRRAQLLEENRARQNQTEFLLGLLYEAAEQSGGKITFDRENGAPVVAGRAFISAEEIEGGTRFEICTRVEETAEETTEE